MSALRRVISTAPSDELNTLMRLFRLTVLLNFGALHGRVLLIGLLVVQVVLI